MKNVNRGISYDNMFKKRNLYYRLEKIEFLDEELEQLESNYGQISSMADRDILEEIKKIHKELDKLKAPRKVYSKYA